MTDSQRLWVRRFTMVSSVIPILFVLAFIGAMTFMDFNQYKPQITQEVADRTGHKMQINGDLSVEIFPFALVVNEVVLENRPGFETPNLMTLAAARLQISLWDLFVEKRLTMTSVELKSPKLFLEVNEAGEENWKNFKRLAFWQNNKTAMQPIFARFNQGSKNGFQKVGFQKVETDTLISSPGLAQPETKALANNNLNNPTLQGTWRLEGLVVNDAEVFWKQAQLGQEFLVNQINLLAFNVQPNRPFKLTLEFDFNDPKDAKHFETNINADLAVSSGLTNWELIDWAGFFKVVLPESLNIPEMRVETRGKRLSLDFTKDALVLKEGFLGALETQIELSVSGQFLKEIHLSGGIRTQDFNLPRWQRHAGEAGFGFQNPQALTNISGGFQFDYDPTGYAIKDLSLKVDKSTFTGQIWKTGSEAPRYQFDIAVDQFNLDDYALIKAETEMKKAMEPEKQGKAGETYLPLALPVDTLKALDASGQFRAGSLQAWQLQFSNFETTISAKQGKIDFAPLDMQLYQGNVQSKLQLDVMQKTPHYDWRGKVNNIELKPFLTAGWQYPKLAGRYNGVFDLKTKGVNSYLLKQNMKGRFYAKVKQGSLVGMDLNRLLAGKASKKGDKTAFKQLIVDGKINKGQYRFSKLELLSDRFNSVGMGWVSLTKSWVDANLKTLIKKAPSDMSVLEGLQVPVNLKGPLNGAKWSVDTKGLLSDPSNQSKKLKAMRELLGLNAD